MAQAQPVIVTVTMWRAGREQRGADLLAAAGLAHSEPASPTPSTSDRHTNVSHTRGCSLLVAAPVRVGVDVEIVRRRPLVDHLARRTMHDTELAEWRRAADADRAFLQHWTRVEAYLKAIGVGVRGGLLTRPPAGWSVLDLDLGVDHVGALAVEAPRPIALRVHDLG